MIYRLYFGIVVCLNAFLKLIFGHFSYLMLGKGRILNLIFRFFILRECFSFEILVNLYLGRICLGRFRKIGYFMSLRNFQYLYNSIRFGKIFHLILIFRIVLFRNIFRKFFIFPLLIFL